MADEEHEQTPAQDAELSDQAPDSGLDPYTEPDAAQGGELPGEQDTENPDALPGRLMLSTRNALTLGRLILHYEARDVSVLVDGDAALRLMAIFRRRREGALGDVLDPARSSARDGWVVLDAQQPLAMSWIPGLPGAQPRTAIDPAIAG